MQPGFLPTEMELPETPRWCSATQQMRERLGETAPISVPRQPAQPAGIQDAAAPATPPNGEQVLMGESPQHSPLLRLPMPEMRSPMPALQLSSETVVGDDDSCANSYADFHADSYASDTASDSEVDSDSDSDTIAEQYHDFALDKRANAVAPAVAPAPPAAAKCETERPASPPAPPAGLVQGAVRLPLGVAGVAPPTQDPTPPAPRNGGAVLLLVMEACGFAAAVVASAGMIATAAVTAFASVFCTGWQVLATLPAATAGGCRAAFAARWRMPTRG